MIYFYEINYGQIVILSESVTSQGVLHSLPCQFHYLSNIGQMALPSACCSVRYPNDRIQERKHFWCDGWSSGEYGELCRHHGQGAGPAVQNQIPREFSSLCKGLQGRADHPWSNVCLSGVCSGATVLDSEFPHKAPLARTQQAWGYSGRTWWSCADHHNKRIFSPLPSLLWDAVWAGWNGQ